MTTEQKAKAKALLRDGWRTRDVARELGIHPQTAFGIKKRMGDIPFTPLNSSTVPKQVMVRLAAGTSEAQIAHDLGIQPETVGLIAREPRIESRALGVSHMQAAQAAGDTAGPSTSAQTRQTGSPQPGTSTGGETHPGAGRSDASLPPAKHPRLDQSQPAAIDPMTSEILRQMEDEVPIPQIAKNLGMSEGWVNQYVLDQSAQMHREFLAERAAQPAAATAAPSISTTFRQEVIRQLNEGHAPADVANNQRLTVFQVDRIKDQYLQEAVADIDLRLFDDPSGASTGHTPKRTDKRPLALTVFWSVQSRAC